MPDLSTIDVEQLEADVAAAVQAGKLTSPAAENLRPWLRESYYAEALPPIVQLIRDGRFDELDRLFWEKIPFGTGGRRGPMSEFGSATINRRTIAESAYGLGVYGERGGGGEEWEAGIAWGTRERGQEFTPGSALGVAAFGFFGFCFTKTRGAPGVSV